jgi:hypothetical protein
MRMRDQMANIAKADTERGANAGLTERCMCGEFMIYTPDAIGRLRPRCPKCQGIVKRTTRPDERLLPQTLVRESDLLPRVAPGQLRCQRCAKGVDGDRRFCAGCHPTRDYKAKACQRCQAEFIPTGPRAIYCERCK